MQIRIGKRGNAALDEKLSRVNSREVYGVFSKSTNARSRSAPVLGRSNFRRPSEHGITDDLQLADMAVAGDGHTPYFENTAILGTIFLFWNEAFQGRCYH
jgi:hypothetical protein